MRSLRDDILDALPAQLREQVERVIKRNRRSVYVYMRDGTRFEQLRRDEYGELPDVVIANKFTSKILAHYATW